MSKTTEGRYKNLDDDPSGPWLLTDITAPFVRPHLIYKFHRHLPPKGRSWRFTQERLLELERLGAIYFPTSGGRPRLKRHLSDIRSNPTTRPAHPSRIEFIVREAMSTIASEIARDPDCLKDVEWRDLERTLREVFEQLGFDTRLTRSGKDGGFDLELACFEKGANQNFIVEVKHWVTRSNRPGLPVVTALFDVVASMPQSTTGVLLSSSGFTKGAVHGRSEVELQHVRLGGREKIVSLCQSYIAVAEGLWEPAFGLPELLLEGTK